MIFKLPTKGSGKVGLCGVLDPKKRFENFHKHCMVLALPSSILGLSVGFGGPSLFIDSVGH